MNKLRQILLPPVKKFESMSRKRRIITAAAAVSVTLALLATIIYAAFLSAGHRKGVAVANGYYFSSNVLTDMGSVDSVPNQYSLAKKETVPPLKIDIRNYDAKLAPDPFDVTYKIMYRLVGTNTANYTYKLTYNGEDIPITSTSYTSLKLESDTTEDEATEFSLPAGVMSSDSFTLTFTYVTGDPLENVAQVDIVAVPVSPVQMTQYVIGSRVTLTTGGTTEFNALGYFDDIPSAGTDITGLAGFLYHVETRGYIPSGQQAYISLSWDTAKLELDRGSEYRTAANAVYTETTTGTESNAVTTATLTLNNVESGEYLSFAFYRPDGFDSTIDPYSVLDLDFGLAPTE